MPIKIKKPGPHITFRSMEELLCYVDTDEWSNPPGGEMSSREVSAKRRNFTWTSNWGEAAALARTGWHDGVKDMSDRLGKLEMMVRYEPSGYYWDVTGLSFDIGAVMSGEPECWLEQENTPKKRFFRFEVNPSSAGGIEGDYLMNRGCAVVALVNLLQQDPHNIVEVDVVRINTEGTYTLKLGMSPIDLDALAYCMAHPSYNRRIMFAVTEKLHGLNYHGSYGITADGMENQSELISTDEDGTVNTYLPRAWGTEEGENMYPFRTLESAAEWVRGIAKRLAGGEEAGE